MGFWDFLSANWWKIGGVGVGYFALTGQNPAAMMPTLPPWSELVAMGAIAAVVGATVVSGRIENLLPDDPTVYVVVVNAREQPPVEVHELSQDKWANTEVVAGSVMPFGPSGAQAYLAYAYDADTDTVVGTWMESKNEAEFVGHHEVGDALEAIGEVRDALEPMAQRGQRIQQYLPSIVRDLDRRRAKAQNNALEGHIAPSIGEDDEDTIDTAIDRHMPEDLKPSRMQSEDARERDDASAGGEFVGLDILDGEESLEREERLRNDGGS